MPQENSSIPPTPPEVFAPGQALPPIEELRAKAIVSDKDIKEALSSWDEAMGDAEGILDADLEEQ